MTLVRSVPTPARAACVAVALAVGVSGALTGCQVFAYIDDSTGAGLDASRDASRDATVDDGGGASPATLDGGAGCDAARCEGPGLAVACDNGVEKPRACDPERTACVGGACVPFPSCRGPFPELPVQDGGAGPVRGAGLDCGPTRDQDCCASLLVDDGGIAGDAAPLAPFRLDRYEVTVERFRHFLAAVQGGWKPDQGLDADGYARAPWPTGQRLTDMAAEVPTAHDNPPECSVSFCNTATYSRTEVPVPINNVTYYEALAFCIWDGGRLPRDEEWRYAAGGGSLHLPLPWSATPGDLVLHADATLDCIDDNDRLNRDLFPYCAVVDLDEVGTRSPRAHGRFGHMDLVGNVAEWTADPAPCPADDCSLANAYVEGGSFRDGANAADGTDAGAPLTTAAFQRIVGKNVRNDTLGIRCAR